MTIQINSGHEVSKLKELLFGKEREVLGEVEKTVDDHHQRIGTDEKFQSSVAAIIADALHEADVNQHKELAAAISPAVVAGIKREIKHSRDDMVDALYPIIGRLVSVYVTSAINEMMDKTNERLESKFSVGRIGLRAKALFSARSYEELKEAASRRFEVEDIFLIHRSNGALLDRWQSASQHEDGEKAALISGLLAAITDFARDAFSSNGGMSDLRALDIGDARVFLRVTPSYILAVKCVGQMSRKNALQLDHSLFAILEENADVLAEAAEGHNRAGIKSILPKLADRLERDIVVEKPKPVMAIALVSLIGLAIAGFYGWRSWQNFQTEQLRSKVASLVTANSAFNGYPVNIEVSPDRNLITVSGLAPSAINRKNLLSAAQRVVQPVKVEGRLAVITPEARMLGTQTDVKGLDVKVEQLERDLAIAASSDSLVRASKRIADLTTQLANLKAAMNSDIVVRKQATSDRAAIWDAQLGTISVENQNTQDKLAKNIAALEQRFSRVTALQTVLEKLRIRQENTIGIIDKVASRLTRTTTIADNVSDKLAGKSDRRAVGQISGKLKSLEDKIASIDISSQLLPLLKQMQKNRSEISALSSRFFTRRYKLEQWVRANVIFFKNGAELRHAGRARQRLAELAHLFVGTGARIRVVGYTDPTGNADANKKLALERAQKIISLLVGHGIARNRLVAIGRPEGPFLSINDGPDSSNRRVGFEITFDGERFDFSNNG